MKSKKERIAVPKETERKLLVESGHKCSVPLCNESHTLEIHHINGDPSDNRESNLIVFCRNHHAMAESGKLDRKECDSYKERLKLIRPEETLKEKVEREGEDAIKRWIDKELNGTSVTVVLIGKETSARKWVRYEIGKSYEKKNGLLGVYIHKSEDNEGKPDEKGDNHFGEIGKDDNGNPVYFWQVASTYDYVDNDGYNNLPKWIEEAAQKAGR